MAFQNFAVRNGLEVEGSVILSGSSSGTTEIKAAANALGIYTLPSALPTVNGQVLSSTTLGVTSWATAGGGTNLGFTSLNSSRDSTATTWSIAPGLVSSPSAASTTSLATAATGNVWYVPVSLNNSINISAFAFNVVTATGVTVGPSVQVFFNNVDDYWQPTTTALYLGEVTNITTTGNKGLTGLTGKILPAGNYLLGLQIAPFTATAFNLSVRSVLSAIPGTQVFIDNTSFGTVYFWAKRGSLSYTSGTPTVAAYTTDFNSTGTPGFSNLVYLRWTKV